MQCCACAQLTLCVGYHDPGIVPANARRGVHVQAWSPLGNGRLTRFSRDEAAITIQNAERSRVAREEVRKKRRERAKNLQHERDQRQSGPLSQVALVGGRGAKVHPSGEQKPQKKVKKISITFDSHNDSNEDTVKQENMQVQRTVNEESSCL